MTTSTAVYTRISRDHGEQLGTQRQEQDARALAERRGWTVGRVYCDPDNSAYDKRKARPQWCAMLDDLRGGRYQAVIVYDMDRIARRNSDLEDLLDIYEDTPGLQFAAVTGDIDLSTSGGRTMARILVSIAHKSSEDTARRVARKHRELAEHGKPSGGGRPFGYAADRVTIVDAEAAAIREAARRVLAGDSLRHIADDLDAAGLHPPRAARWTRPSLKAVLCNPRVAGRRQHQGRDFGPAAWPAILDEETWNGVRAVYDRNSAAQRDSTSNVRRGMLSGLAVCGKCGHGVVLRKSRERHVYACPVKSSGGCGGVYRGQAEVDNLVERLVIARLSAPDLVDLLTEPDQDGGDVAAQITATRERLNQVAAEFADDDTVTPEQFKVITKKLRDKLEALQERQAVALRSSALADLAGRDDAADRWKSLSLSRRRAVIDELMTIRILPTVKGSRRFDPQSVSITWKGQE